MQLVLRKCDFALIRDAIAFGDTLMKMPEATPSIRRNIRRIQELLRKLPEVPDDVTAEYSFGVMSWDPEFCGVNRDWHVMIEPDSEKGGSMITIGSICAVVPDRAEDLERRIEHDFTFFPNRRPTADPSAYRRWAREVADPNAWRTPAQTVEIEADFRRSRPSRKPRPTRRGDLPVVREEVDGFVVSMRGGRPVQVRVVPWELRVEGGGVEKGAGAAFPVVDREGFTKDVVTAVQNDVDATVLDEESRHELQEKIEAQRRRLLANVPRTVVRVQNACIRNAGWCGWLSLQSELYDRKLIVADVLRYRAAAVALANCDFDRGARDDAEWHRRNADRTVRLRRSIAHMENWRGLFSPDGEPYRSLDRTLMNVPPSVPADYLLVLERIRLQRPLKGLAEFGFTLGLVCATLRTRDGSARWTEAQERWEKSLLRLATTSTTAEIEAGAARVFAATRRRVKRLTWRQIDFFVGFLADYPGEHQGRLGGLVTKAIRWHRNLSDPDEVVRSLGLDPAVATAVPPIPPPAVEGIRLLGTVGEIVAEGHAMQHCIAFRAAEGTAGVTYFFHVEHSGAAATIAVDRYGGVKEASGPRNTANRATRWGRQQLEEWSESLRDHLLQAATGDASHDSTVGSPRFRNLRRGKLPASGSDDSSLLSVNDFEPVFIDCEDLDGTTGFMLIPHSRRRQPNWNR